MGAKPWTIKELLELTTDYLGRKGVQSSRLSAEVLLAYQLRTDRVSLYVNLDKPLSEKEVSGYRALVKRRSSHEPIQYITGTQEFWSLEFDVDPGVLIPRVETELLVELALKEISRCPSGQGKGPYKILELGTGCGAIVIALARELDGAEFWATDVSPEAMEVACRNAARHGVMDLIVFEKGDLFAPVSEKKGYFDLILSNPPYVADGEYEGLPPEVREYEPSIALRGQKEGLFFIERIISESPYYMKPGACLMLETAPDQIPKAADMIRAGNAFENPRCYRDYSHNYRAVTARKAGIAT